MNFCNLSNKLREQPRFYSDEERQVISDMEALITEAAETLQRKEDEMES